MNEDNAKVSNLMDILIIRMSDRLIGFDVRQVEEIVQAVESAPLVKAPDFIEGVIRLRGEIVPLIKLREILHFPPKPVDPDMFVIIGRIGENKIGVVVDGIERVVNTRLIKRCFINNFNESKLFSGMIEERNNLIEVIEFDALLDPFEKGHLEKSLKGSSNQLASKNIEDQSEEGKGGKKAADILHKRAEDLARIGVQEIKGKEGWIVFLLNEEMYAVSADFVDEIVNQFMITRLPSLPDYIPGIISLRGKIIPIIDTKKFMGIDTKLNKRTLDEKVISIIKDRGFKSGFLVDSVTKKLDIEQELIEIPLITSGRLKAEFVSGQTRLKEGLLIMLDGKKIKEYAFSAVHSGKEIY